MACLGRVPGRRCRPGLCFHSSSEIETGQIARPGRDIWALKGQRREEAEEEKRWESKRKAKKKKKAAAAAARRPESVAVEVSPSQCRSRSSSSPLGQTQGVSLKQRKHAPRLHRPHRRDASCSSSCPCFSSSFFSQCPTPTTDAAPPLRSSPSSCCFRKALSRLVLDAYARHCLLF